MKRIIFDSVDTGNDGHGTILAVLTLTSFYHARTGHKLEWSKTGFSLSLHNGNKGFYWNIFHGFSFTRNTGNGTYEKNGLFCNWLKYKFDYDSENQTFSKVYI